MALLGFEGFDHYANNAADILNRRDSGWQWNSNVSGIFGSPGRNGSGGFFAVGQNAALSGALGGVSLQAAYFGFAAQIVTVNFPGQPFFYLFDAHSGSPLRQISIGFNMDRAGFDVYRNAASGGVLIASSPNNVFSTLAWHFFEFYVGIGSSTGALRIRVDGREVINLTGLNTQVTGNAFFDGIVFHGPGAPTGTTLYLDDFYICDTTTGPGPWPNNTFLGDVTVKTLYPIGNSGTVQWTPLANTNWQEVAEVHTDGDASYNFTATVGNADLLNFQPLTATVSAVVALQTVGNFRKDDAGTRQVTQEIVSGGTLALGTAKPIPTNYVYLHDLFVIDPATGLPWTASGVNALQAGYVLTT